MALLKRSALRNILFATTAIGGLANLSIAHAQLAAGTNAAAAQVAPASDIEEVVVTDKRTTRSSVDLSGTETQKLLPGISPLKAIETLPGVVYETADPWGNNEQNESLVIHGFTTQQLGYTMDGVPLGDQQYGNYNGLSVSRAVISENVARVNLSSGTGSLGVASTSNLGGAIETYSSDPLHYIAGDIRETGGSYGTNRTFVRFDTGDFLGGNSAYVSYLHQDAKAWDFSGRQGGDQVNLKFIHVDEIGKLTIFADYQKKVEPNEDSTGYGNQQSATSTYFPYTRPFIYPNYSRALAYLSAAGAPPAVYGNNFSNYFSEAQREDELAYANYDLNVSDDIVWSNQIYYHNGRGRGVVAGPVNQAGLPGLFGIYFPGQNLVNVFGGTGYEVRTTEYQIDRGGVRSTFNWQLGDHQIEAGLWYENNESHQYRRWYPLSAASNDLTPYDVPSNPVFTQYGFKFNTDDVQLHIQDQWRILPDLLLQVGNKVSLQTASDVVLIQQQNLPTTNPPVHYPTGSLTSDGWLLPQIGAVYDLNATDHLFFNVQKNLRQYIPYGAGSNYYGTSPWSLGSQAAFDQFKATARPETSINYDAGIRTKRDVDAGFLTSVEGQANYYHVNFSNRLFNVATSNFINPNPAILVNVGGVTTDGADVALTLNFGEHFHLYDAVSYNKSTYDTSYSTVVGGVSTIVPIAGKQVPLTPTWLDKFIFSTNFGPFEAQLNGDFIGKRYVTYLNDLSVASTFVVGLEVSYTFEAPFGGDLPQNLKLSGNITNLTNTTGVSTASVTGASGGYGAYPLPPRMYFVTLAAQFGAPSQPSTYQAPPVPMPEAPAPMPVPVPPAKVEAQRSFQVFFDFDKSDITAAARQVIQAAADAVKAGNVVQITVTGHTDTVGSAAYNQALSERRAASVKAALVADGVVSTEISTSGVGKTGLLVPTGDGVREPQNRRAEIVLK